MFGVILQSFRADRRGRMVTTATIFAKPGQTDLYELATP